MQRLAVLGAVLIGLLLGAYLLWPAAAPEVVEEVSTDTEEVAADPEPAAPVYKQITIGASLEGRNLDVYTFGSGPDDLLFVGGIHGGYEWNSSLLAYEFIDYFSANPALIPANLTISIIPVLNPDGLVMVTGTSSRFTAADVESPDARLAAGRFNANRVDLNRNFDCKWAPESTWRGVPVSAGTAPFSEPEAATLRDYVAATEPVGVVFWHSQANNVYASECEDGPLPATLDIMNAYATAGSYGAVPAFTAYPITGDAEGWLASIGIPAITVELESFRSIEWERNVAGVEALLGYYSE